MGRALSPSPLGPAGKPSGFPDNQAAGPPAENDLLGALCPFLCGYVKTAPPIPQQLPVLRQSQPTGKDCPISAPLCPRRHRRIQRQRLPDRPGFSPARFWAVPGWLRKKGYPAGRRFPPGNRPRRKRMHSHRLRCVPAGNPPSGKDIRCFPSSTGLILSGYRRKIPGKRFSLDIGPCGNHFRGNRTGEHDRAGISPGQGQRPPLCCHLIRHIRLEGRQPLA